ncbi:MaoC/PaaZ C-terminal domain-containing protein [Dactylosporangium sp. CA-139066]|uniref:MaoC/PaaZ C-terminal domain-containing protein n=1 Tax=Dactylosporangium sp. CA-139066 TaxID=3239930 RepID=UPI003D90473B
MPVDPARVGTTIGPWTVGWTERDSLLYALAVGAGQQDPLAELAFTTENSGGVPQQVVPSFAVVLGFGPGIPDVGEYDPTRAVHAEQEMFLTGPLPAAGQAQATVTVTDIWDKGRDAIVWTETTLVEAETGRLLARCRTGAFLGGAGGFGGARGSSPSWELPGRAPDVEVSAPTRPEQALLYRLTGDRNPLHSDPAFAARGGFPRPILHGLCTYGYTTRILLNELAGGDAARLASIRGRFTRPVLPGDDLVIRAWRTQDDSEVLFQTTNGAGEPVLDRGVAVLRPGSGGGGR